MSPTVPPTSVMTTSTSSVARRRDAPLDLVGDVRDDLHRLAEVVAPALRGEHRRVDRPGGGVRVAGEVLVDEALVVAEVEVGLAAVVGDEHLTVLERVHRARVDVDVRVELLHRDPQAPGLEQPSERGRRDALPEGRRHAPRDEDVLGHRETSVCGSIDAATGEHPTSDAGPLRVPWAGHGQGEHERPWGTGPTSTASGPSPSSSWSPSTPGSRRSPGGFVGVDVFFVLSGYLITRLLVGELATDGRLRLARFYARRMRRLLPGLGPGPGGVVVASVHLLDRAQQKADRRRRALGRACGRPTGGSSRRAPTTSPPATSPAPSCTTGPWRSRSSSTWSGRHCSSASGGCSPAARGRPDRGALGRRRRAGRRARSWRRWPSRPATRRTTAPTPAPTSSSPARSSRSPSSVGGRARRRCRGGWPRSWRAPACSPSARWPSSSRTDGPTPAGAPWWSPRGPSPPSPRSSWAGPAWPTGSSVPVRPPPRWGACPTASTSGTGRCSSSPRCSRCAGSARGWTTAR